MCVKWKPLEMKLHQYCAGYKHVDSKGKHSREQRALKKRKEKERKKKKGGWIKVIVE